MRRVLAVAVVAAAVPAPPSGGAATLLYECRPNLCSVNPDGSERRRITRGGTADRPYQRPTRSLDGRRMAYTAPSGRAYMREGRRTRQVGFTIGQAVVHPRRRYALFMTLLGGTHPWLCKWRFDPPELCGASSGRIAWGPGVDLLVTTSGDTDAVLQYEYETHRAGHVRTFFQARRFGGFEGAAALSPDGRWIVVPESFWSETNGPWRMALYSTRTGRWVRDLTRGHYDGEPTWSPDGREVAFVRWTVLPAASPRPERGSIRRVSRLGGPVRVVVPSGLRPFWGT